MISENRRAGLALAAGLTVVLAGCTNAPESENLKPNIIYIYTDQQHAGMMSCAGNEHINTPAMDYIAENGIRFTRAYTTNPVCSPARVSMMTGRFPGEFRDNNGNIVRENTGSMRITDFTDEVKQTTLSAFMKKAGYNLVYGGKEHLPDSLTPAAMGFTDITDNERDTLAMKAAEFIRSAHDQPYFMILSFINPHDICYMAIRDFSDPDIRLLQRGKTELAALDAALQLPENVSREEFFANICPPLPPNFEPQEDEPEAIHSLVERREFKMKARELYTEEQWRMHRWAYVRLTERVDRQVQVVLNALKESGAEENTLIIFSSDHGDMDASHRLEHKTTLYEESVNIPFLAMWKGHIPAGLVDSIHLVSNGLDLLPTISDYAGIEGRSDPRGKSLKPLFEGKKTDWRNTLGIESEIGRMVVDESGLKYIKYDATGIEEQLLDLDRDPFETRHFTDDPEYADDLNRLKKIFETEWFPGF